jgi:hypothetical protein
MIAFTPDLLFLDWLRVRLVRCRLRQFRDPSLCLVPWRLDWPRSLGRRLVYPLLHNSSKPMPKPCACGCLNPLCSPMLAQFPGRSNRIMRTVEKAHREPGTICLESRKPRITLGSSWLQHPCMTGNAPAGSFRSGSRNESRNEPGSWVLPWLVLLPLCHPKVYPICKTG